jgi:catechol 2,3-dioxygenase-like lactoylglutathione lyase family enzyme
MIPQMIGLRHVALYVTDVDRSVAFYRDVFGMELEWRPDPDNAYLTSGSDNLALHSLPPDREPGEIQTLDHIGFVVREPKDVDVWAAHVSSLGFDLAKQPKTHRDGARSFYLRDPDGILIQVIHHPPISDK